MLVNPFVKQTTLRFRKGKVSSFLGDFVPQLLNQTDFLGRGQFPERLDDWFCAHGATLRPPAFRVQSRHRANFEFDSRMNSATPARFAA